MKLSIFDGDTQVEYIELSGDVSDYDIVIQSSTDTEFPSPRTDTELPSVPKIDPDSISTENNRRAYERLLNNPESQVSNIRETIFRHQVLTREQMESLLKKEGYEPRGGSAQTALIVLENVTEEITRIGEGDTKRIVWTGEGY